MKFAFSSECFVNFYGCFYVVFHRHQTTAQIKDGSPNKLEEKAAVLAELAKSLNTIPENVKGMSSDEIDAVLKDVIKKTKMHRCGNC